MYEINDFVCIENPEYEELSGVAKIVKVMNEKAVTIEFCDDKSRFHVATRLLRKATKEETEKAKNLKPL